MSAMETKTLKDAIRRLKELSRPMTEAEVERQAIRTYITEANFTDWYYEWM